LSWMGAYSLPPALVALLTAARDSAICSVGGEAVAQAINKEAALRPVVTPELTRGITRPRLRNIFIKLRDEFNKMLS
jgi:stage V sporulation protein SpoVS